MSTLETEEEDEGFVMITHGTKNVRVTKDEYRRIKEAEFFGDDEEIDRIVKNTTAK